MKQYNQDANQVGGATAPAQAEVAQPTPPPTPAPTAQATTPAPTGGLEIGIDENVKSHNRIPFIPTNENPITKGFLTEVKSETREVKNGKNKGMRSILVFTFMDIRREKTHEHVEWEANPSDPNFGKIYKGMQERIKHIFTTYAPFPTDIKGFKSFKEFFDRLTTAFNTGGAQGTPIYQGKPTWIKVIYSLNGNGQLGFPLSPNFVELVVEGRATNLFINKQYETLEQPKGTARGSSLPGGGGASPDFANNPTTDFPSFS